jgi:hypothetical protein
MDAVAVLRQLWHHRLFVAIGIALALVIAILISYKVTIGVPPTFESRQYQVGVASAEVLVDSPSSQVADLGGGKVRTDVTALTSRARLLANLMAASPLKDQIAVAARIDPGTFSASAPSIEPSQKPTSLEATPTDRKTNVMTVYFNETLPIITVDAQASNEATAARIASAGVAELGKYLTSVAALDKVPGARKLVVDPLGAARFGTVQRGPRKLMAIAAFVLLFGLWCTAIVVISRLARGWRQAAAQENGPAEPAAPSAAAVPGPPRAGRRGTPPPAPARAGPGRVHEVPELPELPERPARRNRVA